MESEQKEGELKPRRKYNKRPKEPKPPKKRRLSKRREFKYAKKKDLLAKAIDLGHFKGFYAPLIHYKLNLLQASSIINYQTLWRSRKKMFRHDIHILYTIAVGINKNSHIKKIAPTLHQATDAALLKLIDEGYIYVLENTKYRYGLTTKGEEIVIDYTYYMNSVANKVNANLMKIYEEQIKDIAYYDLESSKKPRKFTQIFRTIG